VTVGELFSEFREIGKIAEIRRVRPLLRALRRAGIRLKGFVDPVLTQVKSRIFSFADRSINRIATL
jgi:hypothetical protein